MVSYRIVRHRSYAALAHLLVLWLHMVSSCIVLHHMASFLCHFAHLSAHFAFFGLFIIFPEVYIRRATLALNDHQLLTPHLVSKAPLSLPSLIAHLLSPFLD